MVQERNVMSEFCRKVLVSILALTLFSGCSSSSEVTNFVETTDLQAVTGTISRASGGELSHPGTGHTVTFSANSLSADSIATLALLSGGVPGEPHPDFSKAGTAVNVHLGGSVLSGTARVSIPFNTDRPDDHRLYWVLPSGFLFPLNTEYNANTGIFQAEFSAAGFAPALSQSLVNQNHTPGALTFGLLDEQSYLTRPDHVDWPSYNLYHFQNGAFQKLIDQGQPVLDGQGQPLPIPDPGNRPLMVVHGLGSDIPNFTSTVVGIEGPGNFTNTYGFEYDTLSAIATSGPRLREAYALLEQNSGRDWHHLAHSMGCLVSRQGIENGGSLPYQSNNVVFAAGPHLGSAVINDLQGSASEAFNFFTALVVNNLMDFKNADGTACKVSVTDQGFSDLAVGSQALSILNNDAPNRHPKETYRTLGGNDRGLEFDAVDAIIGTYLDDGFVDVASANPGSAIGTTDSQTVPNNHLTITTDAQNGQRVIIEFLNSN